MIALEGGHLICPTHSLNTQGTLLIDKGIVIDILKDGRSLPNESDIKKVDCTGSYILPGFVDVLCESGEPDKPWLEGLKNLGVTALRGGFTHIVHGPGLHTAIDTPAMVTDLLFRGQSECIPKFDIISAATCGNSGEALTEMGRMVESGVLAFSDGYGSIANSIVLRRVMEYIEPFGRPFFLQPTDLALESGGLMHEGITSTQIGLHGIPEAAELIGVTRALALCRQTGCPVHLSHVTTQRGVALVAMAKNEGLPITAGVPARHLLLQDELVRDSRYDTSTKVRPPLRPEADRLGLIEGIRRGVIDVVFAEHHPCSRSEKELEYSEAEFGAVGLESAPLSCFTALGDIALVAKVMSSAPSKILGLDTGIAIGKSADLVMMKDGKSYEYSPPFQTTGVNEPLLGKLLKGTIWAVCCEGQMTHFNIPEL